MKTERHTTHGTRTATATDRGFTLVELIIYIAILAIVVGGITQTAVSLLDTFAHMRAREDVASASVTALERITRELRFATAVDIGASTLGASPGRVTLDTVNAGGTPTTVAVYLQNGRVYLSEGGGAASPLTHAGVTVTNLVFRRFTSTNTEGVAVEMTVERAVRNTTVVKQYRTFVVLDAS